MADRKRLGFRPARLVIGVIAACTIVLCAGALVVYAQGGDPLAFLSSSAFMTTTEASGDSVASTTSDAPVTGGDTIVSSDGSVTTVEPGTDAATSSVGGASTSRASGSSNSSVGSGSSDDKSSNEDEGSSEASDLSVSVTVDGSAAGAGSSSATVRIPAGSSVYDALLASGANVNATSTSYGIYVAGIGGLAEKEHGSSSGWVYAVNGSNPSVSCSSYTLSDGDAVVWSYVNVKD